MTGKRWAVGHRSRTEMIDSMDLTVIVVEGFSGGIAVTAPRYAKISSSSFSSSGYNATDDVD